MNNITDSLSPKEALQEAIARAIYWTEVVNVPDVIIRFGIRRLLKSRLFALNARDPEQVAKQKMDFIQMMKSSPAAVLTDKANDQHYELPAVFFERVLGRQRKYSCGYWSDESLTLDESEEQALRLTCDHAELLDGQNILELGCGWGSLSLYMARHYPNSHIVSVSNSHSQREYIMQQARDQNVNNLTVITADMRNFSMHDKFDRIVSVEMFEHMRNYPLLFERINGWLTPNGLFFMHIFCHRDVPYLFEVQDKSDWMSEFFFSGGMMPSDDLPHFFQDDLKLKKHWRWSGQHYAKTSNAWLQNMDQNEKEIRTIFNATYGPEQTKIWWRRWRIFFMACAELFAYNNGNEWWVSHYAFIQNDRTSV